MIKIKRIKEEEPEKKLEGFRAESWIQEGKENKRKTFRKREKL